MADGRERWRAGPIYSVLDELAVSSASNFFGFTEMEENVLNCPLGQINFGFRIGDFGFSIWLIWLVWCSLIPDS